MDNLDPRLVEIDVVRFEGHGFSMVDNRLFALQLVQSGLTPATLFLANGQVAQAADVLYKRPIVLMRGSFNPVCNLHLEVMAQVKKTFLSHINETQADRCMEICEISMNNLLRGDDVDHLEFPGQGGQPQGSRQKRSDYQNGPFRQPVRAAGALHERTHCHRPLHRPAE